MLKPSLCLISITALLPAFSVFSAEYSSDNSSANNSPKDKVTELAEVKVLSESFAQKMGTQKIDSEVIQRMATGNGTVSELLKNNPNVQTAGNNSLSEAQGEIAPENVSFHGERFYNNLWLIDGLSNNDNINPGSNNGSRTTNSGLSPFSLPDGGTQSFWLNADLLESVEVYDSNISARYGQFTGGVVDAKLREPDTLEASGSLSYRTTRDDWTNFHYESEEKENEVGEAEQIYYQPLFTKNIYSLNVNQPMSDSTALLFSYNRTESNIPFHHSRLVPDTWEEQKRLSETLLLKGLYEADNGDTWLLTGILSPHNSRYVTPNVKDGSYDIGGGGHQVNLTWEHFFIDGAVTSYIGYNETENSVKFEAEDSYSWEVTDSIDWRSTDTTAIEGGYGQTKTNKHTFTLKQDYEFNTFDLGSSQHTFNAGWKSDFAQAQYNRDKETSIYVSTGNLVPSQCFPSDITCIDGEQAANIQTKYLQGNASASNDHHAIYVEDKIQYKQLELTLGLRADHDEFLDNLDVSHRITMSYALTPEKSTVIFGGVNRYYADSLLSYALSANKGSAERYERATGEYGQGWQLVRESTIGGNYVTTKLDTPYSDELNIGFHQIIGNSQWTLKAVNRQGKKQFTKEETDDRTFYLTNSGESESTNYTLSAGLVKPIEWEGISLDMDLGANYLDNKSNFTSYDPNQLLSIDKRVYVDNEIVTYDELYSKLDFNIPWTIFTNINTDFTSIGLNWNQRLSYTAGYNAYEINGESYTCKTNDAICGDFVGNAVSYGAVDYKAKFVVDWRFNYRVDVVNSELEISLDVLNVFDAKVASQGDGDTSNISYKPGRQLWLGVELNW